VLENNIHLPGLRLRKGSDMKVLLITGSYPPMKCGVGAYTQRLAVALAELESVRVTVLTDIRAVGLPNRDGVDVMPVISCWRISELIKIAKQIRQLSPDIVHIQYPTQGFVGKVPTLLPLLVWILGRHCVQTWHEPVLGRGGFWLSIGLDALITVREELMGTLPRLTQKLLSRTPFSWIPAASMLPTVELNDGERLEIRRQYVTGDETLLAFYGFVSPIKGLEFLLEIVAKMKVKLLLACDLNHDNAYHRTLLDLISSLKIASKISILGFLPDRELSIILAASDAIVLPFRDGAQDCNTSIDGAIAQGTFVLTTSTDHNGYNKDKNIYYAGLGDVSEMANAIEKYAGHRTLCNQTESKWRNIATQHLEIYKLLGAS
jgi:glycosyltransferase involved in cell wall biosynthesis